jgi:hypothetical protein
MILPVVHTRHSPRFEGKIGMRIEQFETPVAFIIFNRPQTTEAVLAETARIRPQKLLVIADGPRAGHPDDAERCSAARSIIHRADWDCEVTTDYSETNLGCKQRVSTGLDWVFSLVEEAIVPEDDCLPHPTFFRFCQELLERYPDDQRVMHISGHNFQLGHRRCAASYYFSRFSHVWGWATWRRARKYNDVEMKLWPDFRDENRLKDILGDPGAMAYWTRFLQSAYEGKINTWNIQWLFARWTQNGLSILPTVNLISNIGQGTGATHTAGKNWFMRLPTAGLNLPIQHPRFVVQDMVADRFTQQTMFTSTLVERIRGKARRMLSSRQRTQAGARS